MTCVFLLALALQATALPPAPPTALRSSATSTATVSVRILHAAVIGQKSNFNGQAVHRRETLLPDSAGALRPAVIFEFE